MIPVEDKQLSEISRINKIIKAELPVFKSRRWEMQQKGYEYIRSKQYSDADEAYYAALRRPTYVFNAVFEKLKHIMGEHYTGDQLQKVYCKAGGRPEMAEMWSDILDHVHTENEYKQTVGRTTFAGWLGGGFLGVEYSNIRQIDGSVTYGDEDEFLTMWDSRARHYFLDDADYQIRMRWMTDTAILNHPAWSSRKSKLKEQLTLLKGDQSFERNTDMLDNYTDADFNSIKNGKLLVVEFYEKPYETAEICLDPVTQEARIIDIQDKKRRDLYIRAARVTGKQIIERTEPLKKVTTIIPGLSFYIDGKECDTQDKSYDIIPFFPYPFGTRTVDHFGMMQVALGPQDFLNDMMNRYLDAMNKSSNPMKEFVPDAYENASEIENYHAQPGIVAKKKKNFVGQETLRNIEGARIPQEAMLMAQEAQRFLEMVTVTDELVGREQDKGAPASLYAQKVAQGTIKSAVSTAMHNAFKTRVNNKIIRKIQSNYNTEKPLNILNHKTGESKTIVLNQRLGDEILNNVQVGEYEVVVDDVVKNPLNTAVRNAEKMALVRDIIMPMFGPQAAFIPDWDDLLLNANMGDMKKWAENIKAVIGQMGNAQAEQAALDKMNQIVDTGTKLANAGDEPALNKQATGRPVNSPSTQQ